MKLDELLELCDIVGIFWPAESLSAAEETFLTTVQLKIGNLCIKTAGRV